ncbi:hypothetical protein M407DRAFT_232447 [Tulasnella calospora MUT 4182]|uniref:Uncharacterized protein n=1 Tax=Tulasnella calospora MUT 4182 TaxID=1051891 RepID=A0A0C3QB55_9AGAM|nr:hypothetical protein M407DRAFT_232447 [Tulasnella calospora MUT 4182]
MEQSCQTASDTARGVIHARNEYMLDGGNECVERARAENSPHRPLFEGGALSVRCSSRSLFSAVFRSFDSRRRRAARASLSSSFRADSYIEGGKKRKGNFVSRESSSSGGGGGIPQNEGTGQINPERGNSTGSSIDYITLRSFGDGHRGTLLLPAEVNKHTNGWKSDSLRKWFQARGEKKKLRETRKKGKATLTSYNLRQFAVPANSPL